MLHTIIYEHINCLYVSDDILEKILLFTYFPINLLPGALTLELKVSSDNKAMGLRNRCYK